jgi:hypothetical protein
MDSAGQSKAVSNAVWATVCNGPDVCCLNFGAPAAVDELDARDGAGVMVGCLDCRGKGTIPERALDDL